MAARLLRWLGLALAGLCGCWLLAMLAYRWLEPPLTPLMLLRLAEGQGIERSAVGIDEVAASLPRAIVASEDNNFCRHHGIDWDAVSDAIDEYGDRGRLRGASTVTMQLARNLFLWPGGGFLRKAVEAPLALALDAWLPKRRIIELYVNVVEWGPGIYGAEAAARHHIGIPAKRLSPGQSALLAAVLPNPLRWSAGRPTDYIRRRASLISGRVGRLQGYFACLEAGRP